MAGAAAGSVAWRLAHAAGVRGSPRDGEPRVQARLREEEVDAAVAGAILVVLGFIWLAHRQRKGAEAKLREMANGIGQLRSQRDAQLAQKQRKAKRAEQTKDRRSQSPPGVTLLTAAECREIADRKMLEAKRDRLHGEEFRVTAEAWLVLAEKIEQTETLEALKAQGK